MRTSLVVGVFALCMFACRGKELASAQLAGPGTADVQFQSTGKPLVLWADTDGEWHGGPNARFAAHYEIDVSSKGAKIGHIACDTNGTPEAICGVQVSEGNTHHGDCELKLACELPTIPAGPAALHVVGKAGAGTSNITKMSINIRSK